MRRFSSEGSLLDLDFQLWRKISLKDLDDVTNSEQDTCASHLKGGKWDGGPRGPVPTIQEPSIRPELSKEHSISAENLSQLGKLDVNHLSVGPMSPACRAYSDGQLGPTVDQQQEEARPASPSLWSTFPSKSQQKHQHRAKLSAAKLHLKGLFGQVPHSSNSSLSVPEQSDSAAERRSRLLFMRQWSQVGHRKKKLSRAELEKWAESIDALLSSPNGVAVFEAFLRSEFSEENLLFYLACEQYKHSSNNFSLQRRAKHIYATYIQPGAPREVNLDSQTRELTMQLLQAPSHSSLSHAQRRIYSLLDLDCYPRFLQSHVYLSLLPEAE